MGVKSRINSLTCFHTKPTVDHLCISSLKKQQRQNKNPEN